MLAALAAAAASGRATLVSSTVTLTYQGSDYGDVMNGAVGSRNRACRGGRTVTLIRAGAGAYTETTSRQSGHFKLNPKGQVFPAGDYHARASRKVLSKRPGKRRVCKAASSPTVTVAPFTP
jgi:hypothetical protein